VTSERAGAPLDGSFAALGVAADLVDALATMGVDRPFPVQTLTIPDALAGRDVCGKAPTGSGKTLAFGIPIVERTVRAAPDAPGALVLAPTRELARQIGAELTPVAAARGLRVHVLQGGAAFEPQIAALHAGVDIAVATPGRLLDLLGQGLMTLGAVRIAVVDEADRMADLGFLPQVRELLALVPADRQTMLFSATLDGDVGHLVRRYMNEPEEVSVDAATDTVGTMHHLWLAVHHMDKDRVVGSISSQFAKTIVFCQTKRTCDRVEANLVDLGVKAAAIHGDLAQSQRERALKRFTDGELHVLVATDVAARGIDIDDIGAVIHYEPAGDSKDYLHRSGRTARAGRDGWAVTLVEYNQHTQVRMLQRTLRLPLTDSIEVFSNDVRLKDLPSFEL
jgi:superfamily II DNA/RNA helicase